MASDPDSNSPCLSKVKFRHLELNFRGLMADIDVQTLTTERRDNQAWVEASKLEKKLYEQIDLSESEHSDLEEINESKRKGVHFIPNGTISSNEKNTKPESNFKNIEVSFAQNFSGCSKTDSLVITKPKETVNNDLTYKLPSEITCKDNFEISKLQLIQERIIRSTIKNCTANLSSSEPSTSKNDQISLSENESNQTMQINTITMQNSDNHISQTLFKVPLNNNCQKKLVPNSDLTGEERKNTSQMSLNLDITSRQKSSWSPQRIELTPKPLDFAHQNFGNPLVASLRESPKNPTTNAADNTSSTLHEFIPRSGSSFKNNYNDSSLKITDIPEFNSEAFSVVSSTPKSQPQPTNNNPNIESLNKENYFVIPDASIQIPKVNYRNPRGKTVLTGPPPAIQITPCEGIEVGRNSDQSSQPSFSSDSWRDYVSPDVSSGIWTNLQISEGERQLSPYKLMSTPVKILKQAPSASPLTPRRLAIPMANSPINKKSLNPQSWIDNNDNNTELQAWLSSCNESDNNPTNFSTDQDSNPFIPPIATSTPRASQRIKRNAKLSLLNCAKSEGLGANLPDLEISPSFNALDKNITNVHDLKNSPVSNCIEGDWPQLEFDMNDSPEKFNDNNPSSKRRSHISCTFPQDLSLGFTSQMFVKEDIISSNIPVIIPDENPNSDNNSDNESIKTVTPSFLRSQIDIDVSDLKPSTPLRELQERRARELAIRQSKSKTTELQSPEKSQDFDGSYVVGSVLDDGFSADGSILHTNPIPQWARPGDQLDQKILAMQNLDLDDFFGGFRPANLKQLFGNKSLSIMSTPPPPPVIIPYTQMDSPFYPVNEFMIKPVQPPKPAPIFQRVISSTLSSKISSAPTTGVSSPSSKVLSFKSTKDTVKTSFKLPVKVPINSIGINLSRNKVNSRPLTRAPSKLVTQMPQKQARRLEGATSLSNARRKI